MTAPPVSFMGVPRWPVTPEGKLMLNRTETPPGTCGLPCRALTWHLTWCEGSARPLHVPVRQALSLMTGMPHWERSPLLYDMGHLRESRVLGRPPATRSRNAECLSAWGCGTRRSACDVPTAVMSGVLTFGNG